MTKKYNPPPFEPTLHPVNPDPDLPPMYALNMGDGYAHLLGERWQVFKIAELLNRFLETGEEAEEMDDLAEELGFKWLTVEEAVEVGWNLKRVLIAPRTIRAACQSGQIRKAKKTGRTWQFSQARFIGWLNTRPKPGRPANNK